MDMLDASGLSNKEIESFVLPNAIDLVDTMPRFINKMSKFITDTAAKIRELSGAKISKKNLKRIFYGKDDIVKLLDERA
jgi:hypothetical protein